MTKKKDIFDIFYEVKTEIKIEVYEVELSAEA